MGPTLSIDFYFFLGQSLESSDLLEEAEARLSESNLWRQLSTKEVKIEVPVTGDFRFRDDACPEWQCFKSPKDDLGNFTYHDDLNKN